MTECDKVLYILSAIGGGGASPPTLLSNRLFNYSTSCDQLSAKTIMKILEICYIFKFYMSISLNFMKRIFYPGGAPAGEPSTRVAI